MTKAQRDIKRKLRVLNYEKELEMFPKLAAISESRVKFSTYGNVLMRSTVKKP